MQYFPRFEVHTGKAKDVGLCDFDQGNYADAVEGMDDEITYVVEFETGHMTIHVGKFCHQHLCDMAREIIDSTPNSGWNVR